MRTKTITFKVISFRLYWNLLLETVHMRWAGPARWTDSPMWGDFHHVFIRNFLSHWKIFCWITWKRLFWSCCFQVEISRLSMWLSESCSKFILLYPVLWLWYPPSLLAWIFKLQTVQTPFLGNSPLRSTTLKIEVLPSSPFWKFGSRLNLPQPPLLLAERQGLGGGCTLCIK